MTYKLNPVIEKIKSPVSIILPGGEKKEYESGAAACSAVFDKRYVIDAICPDGEKIEVVVKMPEEESDWIEENVKMFGTEPNLFDGV